MKRFYCICGQEVFFHNRQCGQCGRAIAFDPHSRTLYSGQRNDNQFLAELLNGTRRKYRLCDNYQPPVQCNWLLNEDDSHHQCLSCRTTQTIPDMAQPKNPVRWKRLEQAKRRLFYTLLSLNLDVRSRVESGQGLAFQFLEDQRTNPNVEIKHVLTGHDNGLITLNAAEADEGFLHTVKDEMNERYRTVLGHFRHEVGHYYWQRLLHNEQLSEFRKIFGDERTDYQKALKVYYEHGPVPDWQTSFISAYASCHPLEDWAESWAHYLHITDTLETAHFYGLTAYEPSLNDFDVWFSQWGRVVQIMNALNRSMGMADAYPFVLSQEVLNKLRFIDQLVDSQSKAVS